MTDPLPSPRRLLLAAALVAGMGALGSGVVAAAEATPSAPPSAGASGSASPSQAADEAADEAADADRDAAEEATAAKAARKEAQAARKAARAAGEAAREPATAPGTRHPKTERPAVTGPAFVCDPALSHGQNVSAYARSLPKGPGRGRLVSQAARSDCGKPPGD